jgi:hypothetical protein
MYAHVNFETTAVCSFLGEFLPKALFKAGNEEDLPESLDFYKNWSAKQAADRRLNINPPMCIQDPFVLGFNVGTVVKIPVLFKFQVACAEGMRTFRNRNRQMSLLDAFVLLPEDIGEKKLVSLQEKQKQTSELIDEIRDVFTIPKTQRDEAEEPNQRNEKLPLHLRPFDEIALENTIRLGNGWQCYRSFQPDTVFQEMFGTVMKRSNLSQKYLNANLFQRMKILWVSFAEEFFYQLWGKCFEFQVDFKEHTVPRRLYSCGPGVSSVGPKLYANMFGGNEKKNKPNVVPRTLPAFTSAYVQRIAQKLTDTESKIEKILYIRATCTVHVAVWEGREKIMRKLYLGEDQDVSKAVGSVDVPKAPPTSDKETCPNVAKDASSGTAKDTPSGTAKETSSDTAKVTWISLGPVQKNPLKPKGKNTMKKLRRRVKKDPLEIEAEITKTIVESTKVNNPGKEPLLIFSSSVKIDNSIVDKFPSIYLIFEKVRK